MIELKDDSLVFSFPEVHEHAQMEISFQRTLRIPDNGEDHFLPPGLGDFPLRHVDDFAERVPAKWLERGGIMLPMYQSEALWLSFTALAGYPFAVKIAAGKINAVSGDPWQDRMRRRPDQDYLVLPDQPWLDGFSVEKGIVRQFVAMPLGSGYSAEEQITDTGEHGGLQILVRPLRAEAYERMNRRVESTRACALSEVAEACLGAPDMGLAPGGRMRQHIYEDENDWKDWDHGRKSRCFVHLTNSLVWRAITGETPPTVPPTAREYTDAGLPWFDWYADHPALEGSKELAALESVLERARKRGDNPLPENEPVDPDVIVRLRPKLAPGQVREGKF
jgi:hypothetical protein